MSPAVQLVGRRRQILPNGGDASRLVRLALLLPVLLLLGATLALLVCCAGLLDLAAAGRPVELGLTPVYLAAGAFALASVVVVVVQAVRVAGRVAGPEHRLCLALQRIRAGDLGFRVHLRRGDLLGGLARECNDLLDWLNANPPRGVRCTGGDLVELEQEVVELAVPVAPAAPASDVLSLEESVR